MTSLEIRIALHYHKSAYDYHNGNFLETEKNIIRKFIQLGLLTDKSTGRQRYKPTDKLHFYCDYLFSVPLPEPTWVIPPHDK